MPEDKGHNGRFRWKDLGDIAKGRPNLGPMTTVAAYRLMQYTLKDVLDRRYGSAEGDGVLYEAGYVSGVEFCNNMLDTGLDFYAFVADLREKLSSFGIGILRAEKTDLEKMEFVFTVSEDLDCSGLPVGGDTVCTYDEGFIAGVFNTYTSRDFDVKEVDCWATGARICRFRASAK